MIAFRVLQNVDLIAVGKVDETAELRGPTHDVVGGAYSLLGLPTISTCRLRIKTCDEGSQFGKFD